MGIVEGEINEKKLKERNFVLKRGGEENGLKFTLLTLATYSLQ